MKKKHFARNKKHVFVGSTCANCLSVSITNMAFEQKEKKLVYLRGPFFSQSLKKNEASNFKNLLLQHLIYFCASNFAIFLLETTTILCRAHIVSLRFGKLFFSAFEESVFLLLTFPPFKKKRDPLENMKAFFSPFVLAP